jgi:carboxymethylenebutenolidase
MSRMIRFKRPDGKDCPGFYVEPAAGTQAPAIVALQEWWGLNDQIKGVAAQLAAAGYRALLPDLYRGSVTVAAKEAEHLMQGLNFGEAACQDIRGAVQHLKQSSAKVGMTGFCMGGALTILSACCVPEADAVVAWYGCPPLDYVDADRIRIPLMGHWATEDVHFKIEQVDALEQKLKAAGVNYEFHRYQAQHSFANEMAEHELELNPGIGIKYDPIAAESAWQRTMPSLNSTSPDKILNTIVAT